MRVIVVGGGFSGMAAGCRLAGDGYEVTVLEAAPRLGGRAASFERNGQELYGQHVLLRACGAAQGFLERVAASDAVSFQDSLAVPLLFGGRRWVLRSWPLPGVTHLLPGLLGYAPLSGRERIAASRAGLALWVSRSPRAETFGEWLTHHGQTEGVIRLLWDPIVVATLNAPSSAVSFRAARQVFREAFFVPHGADIGLFTRPLGDVFDAARRYLEARGGAVKVGVPARAVSARDGRAYGVRLADGREIAADAVISAVPPAALAELVSEVQELAPVVGAAERLEWSPIVNVHLTFDRKVLADPFAIGVDSPVQAIFRLAADPASAPAEAKSASAACQPQTLVLSQSAAAEWIDQSDDQVVSKLSDALRDLLPAACDAKVVDSVVLRYRRATFVPSPGSDALRPKCRTPIAGLYLAGDWTATGWPSTIESAVLSGILAAAAVDTDEAARCHAAAESDAAASGIAETDAAARCQAALESDAATCRKPESDIEKGKSEA